MLNAHDVRAHYRIGRIAVKLAPHRRHELAAARDGLDELSLAVQRLVQQQERPLVDRRDPEPTFRVESKQ